MLKQTKYCLMLILAVMIVTTIGASVKNLNTNQYCYQEKNIKLGQTALLYRKHPFRITHVEMTTDLAKVFNQQEQRILKDDQTKQFIVVKAVSSYRSSEHITLNVDNNNIYEVSPFGARRYASSYRYVFCLSKKLSGAFNSHSLRLSVDNPDLPGRTRHTFLLTK